MSWSSKSSGLKWRSFTFLHSLIVSSSSTRSEELCGIKNTHGPTDGTAEQAKLSQFIDHSLEGTGVGFEGEVGPVSDHRAVAVIPTDEMSKIVAKI